MLIDFNGDGLPDVVRSYAGAGAWTDARCQASDTAYASCLEVYLNTGQGFAAMEAPIPVPPTDTVQATGLHGNVVQDLFDVNGDGLPDWIYRRYNAAIFDFDPEWRVLLNLGGTLEPVVYLPQTFLPPPFTEAVPARVWPGGDGFFRRTEEGDTFVDMVDVNGDGLLDRVTTGASGWSVRLHTAGQRPNLLAVMENGLGGTNTVVYRPSTAYDNTGGDAQPDLPFVHWVVDRTRQNDGLCTPPAGVDPYAPSANPCIDAGHDLVASYQYEDGRYDAAAREFRGFRRVVRATSEGSAAAASQVVTVFAQDALAKGRVLQVDTYAGDRAVVRREVSVWGTRPAGANRSQIWLAQQQVATQDLLTGGTPLYQTTVADPPDAYGNITHSYRAGLFDADRVDTHTTYAAPLSGSLVRDKPSQVRMTDARGVLEQRWYHYDGSDPDGLANGKVALGNLARIRARLSATTADGPQTRLAYDATGNLVAVTDDNGHVTTTAYDPYRLYPQAVTNPLGQVTATDVDYRWGLPLRIVDANGAETLFAYDSAGRRVCEARPGDSLAPCTTTTTYHFAAGPGALSWVERATRQDAPHPALRVRHHFDALGRPRYSDATRVVDGLPTTVRSGRVDYDPAGRVARVYDPYLASAAAPDNGSTAYDYHLNGGELIDPLGRIHALTASDGSQRRTHYDGARTTSWDEENQRTESDLDSAGRVVERRSYDGGGLAVTVRQTYDGLGRLLAEAQNGTTLRTITYDALGRRTQLVDADSGSWRYGYDGVGNLRWQDDPRRGQHVQFCYDAGDRPTTVCPLVGDFQALQACPAACASPLAVTYAYDGGVPFGRGRLARVDDGSGSTEVLAYDGRGRRLDVRRAIEVDGISRSARFRYQYDANDRVTAMTYPDGEIVRTEYDDGGQPIALYNTGGTFFVTDARYDLLGRPTLVQHANGVVDSRTYGGAGDRHRLRRLRSTRAGNAVLDLAYAQYSPRGLVQSVVDGRNPTGPLSNSAAFAYDGLGRLTAADFAYDPADRIFAYDALGNLTRNGERTLRFADAAHPHQLTSVAVGTSTTAIAHDPNGNRLGKAGQIYTYDAFDRLARVDAGAGSARFLYDYRGRQAARVVDGSTPFVTRFYDSAIEVAGGFATKWYHLGALRVASVTTTYTAWESAALDRGIAVAAAGLAHPQLRLVLAREAQWMGAALLLIAGTALVAVPGGRRRPVVGIRVRRGPALALALLAIRDAAVAAVGRAAGRGRRRRLGHAGLPPSPRPPRLHPGDHQRRRHADPADPLPALWRRARALGRQRDAGRRQRDRDRARVHRLPVRGALRPAVRRRALLRPRPRHVPHPRRARAVRQPVQLRRRRSGQLVRSRRQLLPRVDRRPARQRPGLGGGEYHHRCRPGPAPQRHRQGGRRRRHRRRGRGRHRRRRRRRRHRRRQPRRHPVGLDGGGRAATRRRRHPLRLQHHLGQRRRADRQRRRGAGTACHRPGSRGRIRRLVRFRPGLGRRARRPRHPRPEWAERFGNVQQHQRSHRHHLHGGRGRRLQPGAGAIHHLGQPGPRQERVGEPGPLRLPGEAHRRIGETRRDDSELGLGGRVEELLRGRRCLDAPHPGSVRARSHRPRDERAARPGGGAASLPHSQCRRRRDQLPTGVLRCHPALPARGAR
ncbi:MAG: toxin TcdB middle/N-terminal domain-containing protein [Candidatus Binatia bacterium]